MIAEKLNQRLKSQIVKNIFFVIGRIDGDTNEVKSKPATAQIHEPDNSQLDETFLESLNDPEIRQAFKRLLKGYARRRQKD